MGPNTPGKAFLRKDRSDPAWIIQRPRDVEVQVGVEGLWTEY